MTTSEEWSIQFDILYNNISSNQAPGLTEYEKSVFLTQAQEAVILDLYKGTLGDGFETTEEVTRYLSSLVTSDVPQFKIKDIDYTPNNIKVYQADYNNNVWFITFQSAQINYNNKTRDVIVVPVKQDTLNKDLNNPFRGPNHNRILVNSAGKNSNTLYSKYPIVNYYIKYLKRPNPIVLDDSEFDINEVSFFEVEIPESLHNQVLLRAVQLAKAVWAS